MVRLLNRGPPRLPPRRVGTQLDIKLPSPTGNHCLTTDYQSTRVRPEGQDAELTHTQATQATQAINSLNVLSNPPPVPPLSKQHTESVESCTLARAQGYPHHHATSPRPPPPAPRPTPLSIVKYVHILLCDTLNTFSHQNCYESTPDRPFPPVCFLIFYPLHP